MDLRWVGDTLPSRLDWQQGATIGDCAVKSLRAYLASRAPDLIIRRCRASLGPVAHVLTGAFQGAQVTRRRPRKHDQDALRAAIHGRGHETLGYEPVATTARTYGELALEVLAYTERIARERMKAAAEARRLDDYMERQRARQVALAKEAQVERERRRDEIRPRLQAIANEVIKHELELDHTRVNTEELEAVRASIVRAGNERQRAIWDAHDTRPDDDLRTAILRLVLGNHGYTPREAAHIANLIAKPPERRRDALRIPSAGNVPSETTARRLLNRMRVERRQAVKRAQDRLRHARAQSRDFAFLRLAGDDEREGVFQGLAGELRAALFALADVTPTRSQYRLHRRARGVL